VLVVEDNHVNQLVAVGMLEHLGYSTEVAGNGIEALASIARTHFAAVVMDCQMPEMDGYEATRALRRDPRWQALPVLAMTANAMVGDREAALAAGMNDHIAKPFVLDEMLGTIAHWVEAP